MSRIPALPFFSDRRTVLLSAIFAAALLVRIFFLCTTSNFYWYGGMVGGFRILAKNVADGRGYVYGDKQSRWFNESFDFNNFAEGSKLPMVEDIPSFEGDNYAPHFQRPPGYSLLIALSYLLFGTGWALSIAQIVADSAVPVLMFMIGRRLGSVRAAYLAAAFYALWPPFARNSAHGMPDALLPVLLSGFVLISLRILESGRTRDAVLGGIIVGTMSLLRSEFMLFGFFFACLIALLDRRRVRQGILVALIAMGTVTPYLVRNYLATGKPYASIAGMVVWEAMGEYPNPWGARHGDSALGEEIEKLGLQNDRVAVAEFYKQRVIAGIKQHPLFFLSEVARRFPRVLLPKTDWGFVEVNLRNPGFQQLRQEGRPMTIVQFFWLNPAVFLIKTVPWIADTFLIVLAFLGACLTLRGRPRAVQKQALLVLVPPVFSLGVYSFIYFEARYIVPAMFAYVLFAVIALDSLAHRWQR